MNECSPWLTKATFKRPGCNVTFAAYVFDDEKSFLLSQLSRKQFHTFVRDTVSKSLSDFLRKGQISFQALWSLRSIDLRVIALHPSFMKLRMLQDASLVPLISEPIRVNVFSFVTYKRGIRSIPNKHGQIIR